GGGGARPTPTGRPPAAAGGPGAPAPPPRLYRDYQQGHFDHPSLQEDEVRRLRSELGWYGDLALAPAGGDAAARRAVLAPAEQTFLACVAVLCWFGIFGLFGL